MEANSFERETIELGSEEEGNLREVEIEKCGLYGNSYSFKVYYQLIGSTENLQNRIAEVQVAVSQE